MGNRPVVVEAAGAVLWRPSKKHGIKVAVIHRPAYDDWSLPKGKAERGEDPPTTAVREVAEETGYAVRLGRHVDTINYEVSAGLKVVHYYTARVVSGEFTANREVDRIEWLPLGKARVQLSYSRDRAVLDAFTQLPADLSTVLLVRHAKAGNRDAFSGADCKRPLDRKGRKQAEALRAALTMFGPATVVSAPLERCRATVAPLARDLGVPVTDEPTMSEAEYQHDPSAARKRIAALAKSASDGAVVVCSQGGVIPGVIKSLASRAGLTLPTVSTPKGSYWVLSFEGNQLRQADHYVIDDD